MSELAERLAQSPAARILVRCPNWLGDVVMTTPGLRTLRQAAPKARIVAQLPAPLAPLLDGSGLCDEIWPLASRDVGLAGWRADVARLRRTRFDLGIAIPESVSSALLMRLGGVRHTVGFARDGIRRRLLDRVIEAPVGWGRRRLVSRERYVLGLLAAIGVEGGETDLVLAVSPGEEERLAWALADAGADPAGLRRTPPVVIAPGASYGDSKCWPAESYAALADRLAARDLPIVLVGAPSEAARVQSVARAMEHPAIVLAGTLDVGALKALLRVARALVANDAGARHVAAAFGTPSLLFFGPTSVRKTADNLALARILEDEHACRPCYLRKCPIDHRCLRSISVARAEQAFERLALDAGSRSTARALVTSSPAPRGLVP